MSREEYWVCDDCGTRIGAEDRGSQWQRLGIAKRFGEEHIWDLCESCDARVLQAVRAAPARGKTRAK